MFTIVIIFNQCYKQFLRDNDTGYVILVNPLINLQNLPTFFWSSLIMRYKHTGTETTTCGHRRWIPARSWYRRCQWSGQFIFTTTIPRSFMILVAACGSNSMSQCIILNVYNKNNICYFFSQSGLCKF